MESLLDVLLQVADFDRQLTPHEVEERAGHIPARLGRGGGQGRMAAGPGRLVGADVVQQEIFDMEEVHLLQIGRGDAPSTLEVAIEAIAEHVAQRFLGVSQRLKFHRRIGGVLHQRQRQRIEGPLRERFVREPFRRAENGPIERAAQHPNLDEVVEMARLQRGILPVVGEAQEFARPRRECRVLAEMLDRGEAEDGRGGAAAFGAERGELGKVAALPWVVGDGTLQTETERCPNEVAG